MTPTNDLILSTLDHFTDGHLIHPIDQLIRLGYSTEFVTPLAETHLDNPDEPHQTLRSEATGKRLERMKGVHDLDILHAIAEAVKADLSSVRAFGSGTRAREYAQAIRDRLSTPAPGS